MFAPTRLCDLESHKLGLGRTQMVRGVLTYTGTSLPCIDGRPWRSAHILISRHMISKPNRTDPMGDQKERTLLCDVIVRVRMYVDARKGQGYRSTNRAS